MNIDTGGVVSSAKTGCISQACQFLNSLPKRLKNNIVKFADEAIKLGRDDPRRIFHAFKVGLAITLVSLFYYFQPLYDGFGVSAMWAVITVVVVFEFTVGATLGKGLNRMVSTCVAGFLGVLAHYLADLSGSTGEPILLALFGFIVASIMTFMRFFPKLKAKYDYGLMIFILTFALVSVSGYRDDEVIKIAQQRLSTIIIGSCIAMLICILICPVWTGTELHNLIASNIDKLADFFQGFGSEYLKTTNAKAKEEKPLRQQYKSVLATKTTEETMANFASWEPSHGKFKFSHPWRNYLKIGALTRQCAYRVDALNNYLNYEVQQAAPEVLERTKEACKNLSLELGKVLKDLAKGIKKMRKTSTTKAQLKETKVAAQQLKSLLQDTTLWQSCNLFDVLPAATVASTLIDIIDCVENLVEEVQELASVANFKSMDDDDDDNDHAAQPEKEVSETTDVVGPHHHVVTIKSVADVTHYDSPDIAGITSTPQSTINTSH